MIDRLVQLGLQVCGVGVEDQKIWHRVARNFSISFGGALVSMLVGVIRTAILTKSLSIENYGRVLIVLNLYAFLSMFAGVRVNDVLYRFFDRFRVEQREKALQGLLWLCLAVSMAVGLLIGGGGEAASSWIAETFYKDVGLGPLFRIYAIAAAFSVFTGFYQTLLRLYDRFVVVVVPQIIGGVVSLIALIVHVVAVEQPRLEFVVITFLIGVLVEKIPSLVWALGMVRRYLFLPGAGQVFSELGRCRSELSGVLFHTNLAGYLKLVFSPGDVFLLGIFSTPSQVALYGLAQQLLKPLVILQNNVQAAVTPEVTSLWAREELTRLRDLVRRYVVGLLLAGGCVTVGALVFARPMLLLLARPEYLEALPIFTIMLVVTWLTLALLIFYPLGVCMDMMKWFNLANLVNVGIVGIAILLGQLNALGMAYVQLVATLIRRVLANLWVWSRLWRSGVGEARE